MDDTGLRWHVTRCWDTRTAATLRRRLGVSVPPAAATERLAHDVLVTASTCQDGFHLTMRQVPSCSLLPATDRRWAIDQITEAIRAVTGRPAGPGTACA